MVYAYLFVDYVEFDVSDIVPTDRSDW